MTATKNKNHKHFICIAAETDFYIKGKVYPLVKNDEGLSGFIAEDGLFDLKSMTVSKFKGLTDEEAAKAQEDYDKSVTKRDHLKLVK